MRMRLDDAVRMLLASELPASFSNENRSGFFSYLEYLNSWVEFRICYNPSSRMLRSAMCFAAYFTLVSSSIRTSSCYFFSGSVCVTIEFFRSRGSSVDTRIYLSLVLALSMNSLTFSANRPVFGLSKWSISKVSRRLLCYWWVSWL